MVWSLLFQSRDNQPLRSLTMWPLSVCYVTKILLFPLELYTFLSTIYSFHESAFFSEILISYTSFLSKSASKHEFFEKSFASRVAGTSVPLERTSLSNFDLFFLIFSTFFPFFFHIDVFFFSAITIYYVCASFFFLWKIKKNRDSFSALRADTDTTTRHTAQSVNLSSFSFFPFADKNRINKEMWRTPRNFLWAKN